MYSSTFVKSLLHLAQNSQSFLNFDYPELKSDKIKIFIILSSDNHSDVILNFKLNISVFTFVENDCS